MTAGGTAQQTQGRGAAAAPAVVKPFYRASMEHRESAGIDITKALTTSDQDLGALPIPAYGYLRALIVQVTVSGGSGGTPTFSADAPFNILKNLVIQEPNGATIYQANNGYDAFLIDKYGGYRANSDPRAYPSYSSAVPNGVFQLRLPLEIRNRDGLGALPNQNSAAAFQLRATLAASTTLYTASPTVLPNVRIRVFAEEYDQPSVSSDGTPNQTTPPAMNTTQYWSPQIFPVNVGNNTIRLTRVGNYIRNLILEYRDATGARITYASNNWPDVVQAYLDTRPFDTIQADQWRNQIFERYGYGGRGLALNGPIGLDDGIFPYDLCHEFDGQVGMELNDGWMPTLSSTRLEIQGTFGVAGTLTVLTNDISVAGNVFMN
jgi:hypothetical protein